jgi:putative glutathione S-transferase
MLQLYAEGMQGGRRRASMPFAQGVTTMGLLVDGKWQDRWYDTASTGGRFERSASQFRNWVTPDGSAGPSGRDGFGAETGRYHLYVSYACPWAHRTLVMRAWKGLEKDIDVSVVHPLMLENGWEFRTDFSGATGDKLYGIDKLYELYLKADPHYSGRVTVPTLWDKERKTIVNNESAEIIRMLGHAFDGIGARPGDYCPDDLRADIDAINATVYDNVNNGVYKAGFATSQQAYDEAVTVLFETLESLEKRLAQHRYLIGNTLTEADLRLWTTLVRFDAVYATHFKCDRKRIGDYPCLQGLLRDIYQMPGVADTVWMDHIRHHYFRSHRTVNPHGIVSVGPVLTFDVPHDRDRLGQREIRGVA